MSTESIPCPLCSKPTLITALETHIAACLAGHGATPTPTPAVVDEDKRAYDAEMERLRIARGAAISEINRSFDDLERELRASAPPSPYPPQPVPTPTPPTPILTRPPITDYRHTAHQLYWNDAGAYRCDGCRTNYSAHSTARWRCVPCDWDLCETCRHSPHVTTTAMGEEGMIRPTPQPVIPRPHPHPKHEHARSSATKGSAAASRWGAECEKDGYVGDERAPGSSSPRDVAVMK